MRGRERGRGGGSANGLERSNHSLARHAERRASSDSVGCFCPRVRCQANAHRLGLSAGARALPGGFEAVRSLLTRCPDHSRNETRDGVVPRRPVKSRPTRSNLMAGTLKPIRRYPPTRLVAGSLSIGHRAPNGFDCLPAARKFARNLLSPIPFGSLSSCQICRCSPEKRPVDIFRVFACASHTPAQSIGGSASGRGGRRLDCTLSRSTCR
jgi:hypothetical protein